VILLKIPIANEATMKAVVVLCVHGQFRHSIDNMGRHLSRKDEKTSNGRAT